MNISEDLKQLDVQSIFDYELDEIEAKVVAIFDKDFKKIEQTKLNEECWLVLDKTCIYATSGGQEADKAYILSSNHSIAVSGAIKAPNQAHLHKIVCADCTIKVGDKVVAKCDSEAKRIISCNHTGEHILQGALRHILDPNIKQAGVNLTHESLSVSFEWKDKLNDNQLKQIEDYCNDIINKSIPINISYKTLDEAIAEGAVAKFDDVYSKIKGLLRIVKINNVYTVLCAGRHAHHTKDLEEFHIIKYSSKGSNVWKIDAITTKALANKYIDEINTYINNKINDIKNMINQYKFDNIDFINQLNNINISKDWSISISNKKLIDKLSIDFNKLLDIHKNKQLNILVKQLSESVQAQEGKYVLVELNNQPSNILNILGSSLINKYLNTGFIITNIIDNKLSYCLISNINAHVIKPCELIKQLNILINGRGGGKPNQCQGSAILQSNTVDKIKKLIVEINNL